MISCIMYSTTAGRVAPDSFRCDVSKRGWRLRTRKRDVKRGRNKTLTIDVVNKCHYSIVTTVSLHLQYSYQSNQDNLNQLL